LGKLLATAAYLNLPRDRPRTRCGDYISDLAWSHFVGPGVEPAELPKISVDREVFRFLLGLLPCDPRDRKSGHENE